MIRGRVRVPSPQAPGPATHGRRWSCCCTELSVWLGSLRGQLKRGLQVPANRGLPGGLPSLSACHTTVPSVSFLGFLKGVPLKRAVSPSRLGPTQPLLSGSVLSASQEGGGRCPPRWALAPGPTRDGRPRAAPSRRLGSDTFPTLALSSKSGLKTQEAELPLQGSHHTATRSTPPVTRSHRSTQLQPSITTGKTTGFCLQFIENKGLKC